MAPTVSINDITNSSENDECDIICSLLSYAYLVSLFSFYLMAIGYIVYVAIDSWPGRSSRLSGERQQLLQPNDRIERPPSSVTGYLSETGSHASEGGLATPSSSTADVDNEPP